MFDFSSGELLVIAVVALIVIKPKDLPAVLRTIGQWTGKIRRMAGEFQDQFREAIREAEVADLKKDIDEATSNLGGGLDPFKDIEKAAAWKPSEPVTEPAAAADAPPAPPAEAVVAETAPAAPAPTHETPAAQEPAAAHEPAAGPSEPAPSAAGGDRAA
ncbi:MAG TPA: Sec-independent protein translocase protein TatB [Xanthobacteraceae bacterium]|jgi:sec-independent protein translocase protein TatB|nr:Sec-independent protein translocase protein TatB [Xanthobacteraceae bacterium]